MRRNRMTKRELRARISRLPTRALRSDKFEKALSRRGDRRPDGWFGRQKEHWLGWLGDSNGPGHYDRKSWDVSAEGVYNRVVNPSMLVWLADAAGVPATDVTRAMKAALEGGSTMMQQSGSIRRVIPWKMIEEALR